MDAFRMDENHRAVGFMFYVSENCDTQNYTQQTSWRAI